MKISFDIPRSEVACLLVALTRAAFEFSTSAAKERSFHRLAGKPFSAETKDVVDAWDKHHATLLNLKADIARQAGVK